MNNKQKPILPKEDEFSKQIKNTPLEKFGNHLINFFSSWTFLVLHLLFFAFWLLIGLYYDLLTFWVSLEAIILSILILIRTKIEQESDRQRAIKDYKIDLSVAKKLKDLEKEIAELKDILKEKQK